MADGRHTEPGDRSFAASLVRQIGAGALLVAVVAAIFWGIGRARDDGSPVIDDPGDTPVVAVPSTEGEPAASEVGTPDEAPESTATPTEGAATEDAVPEPTETDGTEPASGPITVQVLDAAGDDGSAAEDAAEKLRAAGYTVVATNRAVRTYERSTLFYSPGEESAAEAIADDLTQFDVVEEKPDNLSDEVDVHAVVGMDWFAAGD